MRWNKESKDISKFGVMIVVNTKLLMMVCSVRNERASLEDNQHVLSQKLTEKTVSECHLQDQCDLLQKQLLDLEAAMGRREEEFVGVVSKLENTQRECNESKVEVVHLTADLKTLEDQRNAMDSQVRDM